MSETENVDTLGAPPPASTSEIEGLVERLTDAAIRLGRDQIHGDPEDEAGSGALFHVARTALLCRISPSPLGDAVGRGPDGPGLSSPAYAISPEVRSRIDAGRARDGWEAWGRNHSHVLRLALRLDDRPVAELDAFSVTGPWYANAASPDGQQHRLGAGSSLADAVQWCEQATGYAVTSEAASPVDDANSGGEALGRDDLACAAFYALHANHHPKYEGDAPYEEAEYDWLKPENLSDLRKLAYCAADKTLAGRLSRSQSQHEAIEVAKVFLNAVEAYDAEASEAVDRGEHPGLWDQVVEVPVTCLRAAIGMLSASPHPSQEETGDA